MARDVGIVDAEREAGLREGTLTNPYVFAHRAILGATLQYQKEMDLNEPIDFIFDEFSQKKHIQLGWEMFAATRPPELRELLGREPRFESDDEFLPLQAADMLARHAREHWLKHGSLTADQLLLSWRPKNNPRGYRFNFGYPDLVDWFRGARARGVEVGLIPRVFVKVTFSSDFPTQTSDEGGSAKGRAERASTRRWHLTWTEDTTRLPRTRVHRRGGGGGVSMRHPGTASTSTCKAARYTAPASIEAEFVGWVQRRCAAASRVVLKRQPLPPPCV